MALDYVKFQLLAERLIEENGRTLSLVRKDQGNPVDPAKPWRANETDEDISFSIIGVVIDYDKEDFDGSLVRRGDKRALVAFKSVSDVLPLPANLKVEDYDYLIDGGVRWKILDITTIEPGNLRILYDIQVRQ
jgi:hypothetical protein